MMDPKGEDIPQASEESKENGYAFVNDFSDYKPRPFRFKSRRDKEDGEDHDEDRRGVKRKKHDHHNHHRHHHRRHKREKSEHGQASTVSDPLTEMDPERAFRESLFDAMADDEGAAYWEGVYGQPIHIYPKTKRTDDGNAETSLEEMSEDEYAAYVRARMWEKTHQHILEERKLREEAAKKRKEQKDRTDQMEQERADLAQRMEESIRRGAERKKQRHWREAWSSYVRGWERLSEYVKGRTGNADLDSKEIESRIPWPVRTGKQADIDSKEVQDFFKQAVPAEGTEDGLRSVLKAERVRWHPDRMSHRLGGQVDAKITKSVTAVFQIVDAMYTKSRD